MDPAAELELKAFRRQDAMNAVIDRFSSPVQQFYCGATVFVTGGSGFLGKQLVEKLFRSANIKRVYILIRSKKEKTAAERLNDILKDPVYDSLRTKQEDFADRIVPIEGDLDLVRLGINDQNRKMIADEVDIIFHAAACMRFQDPLTSSTITNVRGTRELLDLAKECQKLKSFVHVSTAYSHARYSNIGEEVSETFYPCSIPPDVMIRLVETVSEDRINKIKPGLIRDWPNTYAFTKALAEDLIRSTADGLPICIIRPTIIICTNCEPAPGWIDITSILGPSGIALGSTIGVIHTLLATEGIKIDFVPADYVNNACIVAAWDTARRQARKKQIKIYTVSSSSRNPITWGQLTTALEDHVLKTIVSPQAISYCFVLRTTNEWVFSVLHMILHEIPSTIIDNISVALNKPPRLKKIYATFKNLSAVLRFYINNDWIFIDRNTSELFNSLSAHDRYIYNFEITNVEWVEQIMLWYVGLRKYILKDGLEDTKLAVKRQLRLKIVTFVICGVLIGFICLVFLFIFLFVLGIY